MAAKAPAKAKTKKAKGVKASKTTSALSKFTTAQRSAYQAASKAAIAKAQLAHSTTALQERRLQGAAKVAGLVRQKRVQLIQARVKKNAVSATYKQVAYGRQSKVLRVQAAARLFKAQEIATQKQFAFAGETIHARTTILQTLTNAQAQTTEARIVAAARKRALSKPKAKKTVKGKTSKSKPSPYAAVGRQAGLRAAKATPASKTRTAGGVTPVVNPEWITAGNDIGHKNCVAVAIANHLLFHTGTRLTDDEVEYLALRSSNLAGSLYKLDYYMLWYKIGLWDYGQVSPAEAKPGMIVGFDVIVNDEKVPHCGVLMDSNQVVSWGEVVPLPADIDEAWEVSWQVSRK